MTRYFQGQQEAAYRAKSNNPSMAGISLCATFMCKACGMKKTTPGRKPVINGYSRAGYRCAECVQISMGQGGIPAGQFRSDQPAPPTKRTDERMDMSIIIERVDQTEVFLNEGGGVTIKQDCWPDEAVCIAFPITSIPAIIAALLDVEKEAGGK